MLVFAFGSVFGAVVAFSPDWTGVRYFMPMLLLMVALTTAFVHGFARRGRTAVAEPAGHWLDRSERWYVRNVASILPVTALIVVIGTFLPLLEERVSHWTHTHLFVAIVAFSAGAGCLNALAILSARPMMASVVTRLVAVATLSLGIAGLMAPELMRMAGLGNLPRARLSLESAHACWVEWHLAVSAPPSPSPCAETPDTAAGGLRTVDVDIVSRLGAHYTLAPAGRLVDVPAGRCEAVQGAGLRASDAALVVPPQVRTGGARYFPCVDVPRDAVKLVLR